MDSKDAFSSLISSVPGVDTSGFVKRSLNELKNRKVEAKAASPRPKDVTPWASTELLGKSSPSAGDRRDYSTGRSPIGSSSGGELNVPLAQGSSGGYQGVSAGSGGVSSGVEMNSGIPDSIQFSSTDLDALSSHIGATSPLTMNAEANPVDPFAGFVGPDVSLENPKPAVPEQTGGWEGSPYVSGDLLGLGTEDYSTGVDAGFVVEQHGSGAFSSVSGGVANFEGLAPHDQRGSVGNEGGIPGFDDIGIGEPVFVEPEHTPNLSPLNDNFEEFAGHGSPQGNDSTEEYERVQTNLEDIDEDDNDEWGTDDDLPPAVFTNSGRAKMGKLKLSRISPQMSAAGKAVMARIAGMSKEKNQGVKEDGQPKEKKNRFTKYGATFQKKALEYSKKSIGAVKYGLEVASDWMDKQMEERRKSMEIKAIDFDMDAFEIARELEKLSVQDQELVLDQLDPKMRKKVVELFQSQRFGAGEENPQSGTPSPVDGHQSHYHSLSQSQSPDFGDSEPTQSESPKISRPISIPNFTNAHRMEEKEYHVGKSAPELRTGHIHNVDASSETECDLLGLDDEPGEWGSQKQEEVCTSQEPVVAEPVMADPDDLDTFFGGGTSSTAEATSHPHPSASVDDIFGGGVHGSSSFPDDLIDIGGAPAGVVNQEYSDLYEEANRGESDEPEIRKRLREQRIREKHMKMQDALQDKLLKEQEEAEFQETQQRLKREIWPKIKEWKDGSAGNIRGLLTSLHTVLWEDSGWVPVGVGEVLESNQVKKAYRKANLIVHPDKVRQKNGTEEQTAIADMAFDVLKEAWGLFER